MPHTRVVKHAAQVAASRKAAELKQEAANKQAASKQSTIANRKLTKVELAEQNAARTRRYHLDRRAHGLMDSGGDDDDDLLTSREVMNWLQVSIQFLEIGRSRGFGPPFVRVAARVIRYRRGAVRDWLAQRAHVSTAEYRNHAEQVEA